MHYIKSVYTLLDMVKCRVGLINKTPRVEIDKIVCGEKGGIYV